MNQKPLKGWLKHADFILIDLLCLQLSFLVAYWLIVRVGNPYSVSSYAYLGEVLLLSQLVTIVFSNNYKGIIRRGMLDELYKVVLFATTMLLVLLLFLFVFHTTIVVSRLQVGGTMVLYIIFDYLLRFINKKRIFKNSSNSKNKLGKSLVLITAGYLVDDAIKKLTDPDTYRDHFISGCILTDGDFAAVKTTTDVPIVALNDESINRIKNNWVDEVFVLQPNGYSIDKDLMDDLIDMGITVHICPELLTDDNWTTVEMRKLGKYKVLTSSIKFVPADQLFIKRLMDIAGGIVGCLITAVLFIFVAPAIYIKSPGPIFFSQERIGLNGRTFKMYKFRSMYMDAEERKAALMEQNKLGTGLFFKMDDDPRIIGSEKKDKNGKPKGIGNFIRNTSIDEFPQFWNVLKGDMSLVGTRPPLKSEWNLYDLHHRARMTVKPGITGLWQVSGRSEITDFEEVVRLDREYIENWSIKEDIKILLKTIVVVLTHRGAE